MFWRKSFNGGCAVFYPQQGNIGEICCGRKQDAAMRVVGAAGPEGGKDVFGKSWNTGRWIRTFSPDMYNTVSDPELDFVVDLS